MRVLVCGSHKYCDVDFLTTVLDDFHALHPITTLIHGNAEKTDKAAGTWAIWKEIPVLVFNADWKRFGRAAGVYRNSQMLEEGNVEAVIAFPTGGPGTVDMITKAQLAGLPVSIFPYPGYACP
jgi:YspA, cpYpsA-related SLOG family